MDIEINGRSSGTKRIGKGQTVEMVLENLYAEFYDAFEELDVRDMWSD